MTDFDTLADRLGLKTPADYLDAETLADRLGLEDDVDDHPDSPGRADCPFGFTD